MTERVLPATRRWAVLGVVSAAQFLAILDLWVVNIALPALRHDFPPAGLPAVSWILDAYTIVLAALLVPAGRLADRVGHRRSFLVGLAAFGAASLGCAAAPTLDVLIACRAVQAAGAAVLVPTSLGLALATFPLLAGVLSPLSGRATTRLGPRTTILTGAAIFAAAGAWPLLTAGAGPLPTAGPNYPVVVLPCMLLWGLANALLQPALFATAGAAPRTHLASGSAVLSMARQLGSALGVALLVAVLATNSSNGDSTAPATLDRAWLIVLASAALTAAAGLIGLPGRHRHTSTTNTHPDTTSGTAGVIRRAC